MRTRHFDNLEFSYDEEDDILTISVPGRMGAAAITYETDEGHLVRLDPETHAFIGAEVLAFHARWVGRDLTFSWDLGKPAFWRRRRSERIEVEKRQTREHVFA